MRSLALIVLCAALAGPARAQPVAAEPPAVREARAAFIEGTVLARAVRWGDALAAFEKSARLRPHAVTTYNIGVCLRALAQYTRARAAFRRALAEHHAGGDAELRPDMLVEIQALLGELDRVLATIELTVTPADVSITVDGRPLAPSDEPGTLVAGLLPPGLGQRAPTGTFRVVLDPGTHVFILARPGFADAVHRETVAPGAHVRRELAVARLPARLAITANVDGAAVAVDGLDVGTAPLTLSRPAGQYRVLVRKPGFLGYETRALLEPGAEMQLAASLATQPRSLLRRWWFWASVGAGVLGASLATYFAVRADPTRPPLNGGGLDWKVLVPSR